MRNSILAALMAVALALPAFASEKGTLELDVKLGASFDPSVTMKNTGSGSEKFSYYADTTFSLGAEAYSFVKKDLGLGLGVTNIFESKIAGMSECKVGLTNVYFAAKQKFKTEGFLDSVYFLGRLGYGFVNTSGSVFNNVDTEGGLYWAIGPGVEKNNFLAELVYSVNYGRVNTGSDSIDISSSAINLNLGYKFAL